jgi:putrescine aminotransferase
MLATRCTKYFQDTSIMQSQWNQDENAQLKRDAMEFIIPHFASNEELAKGPKIYVRGEGCWIWDIDGNKYLDTFATLLTTICGHHRPEILEAVTKQAQQLEFFPNYVDAFTVPLIQLARKLAELMPGDLSVSFFINSGSEANETAIKMARQYQVQIGQPQRRHVIGRKNSYHGTTLGGTSATGIEWFREPFGPLLSPDCVFAPPTRGGEADGEAALPAMRKMVEELGPETVACIIMDPIPGSNTGYPLPPEGYLQGVRALCDEYGILLIFDEVQTGFGKTGKWFACEHWNVVPDILTIGKGFTGGYLPLAATVTTPKIADVFRKEPGQELRSGGTYGGHTLCCAATLANIEYIEKHDLVSKAADTGKYLQEQLEKLARFEIVDDVRGIGLLWAVELQSNREDVTRQDIGLWIRDWCHNHGMILRCNGHILVIAPALIISREEIDLMIDLMEQSIAAAGAHFGFGTA